MIFSFEKFSRRVVENWNFQRTMKKGGAQNAKSDNNQSENPNSSKEQKRTSKKDAKPKGKESPAESEEKPRTVKVRKGKDPDAVSCKMLYSFASGDELCSGCLNFKGKRPCSRNTSKTTLENWKIASPKPELPYWMMQRWDKGIVGEIIS